MMKIVRQASRDQTSDDIVLKMTNFAALTIDVPQQLSKKPQTGKQTGPKDDKSDEVKTMDDT
jgi:hypothetical protein